MRNLEVTVASTITKVARYLKAECGVRYWEDASVNDAEDTEGNLIPMRAGDAWSPTIDLITGTIEEWPEGTTADIHYKVCDDGRYTLQDSERKDIKTIEGYVPNIMCPEGGGYGDYVIMKVDGDGKISKFKQDLSGFSDDL